MLGVSPKKTESVDLAKPLASFIQANYSKDELTKVSGTLDAINAARQKMHSSLLKEADFAGALDAHKVYLGLITTTAQRFPFGRLQGSSFFRRKVTSIMVPFIWYDSFRQQKKALEYDANFERASLIYNIGALNSLMAIREDRSSVEGLKRACKYFQVASGVYTYLSTHPELECVMTVDTTGLCYRLLSHLMLAQAQACFFEQAIKSKMSASLVAKLARGTSSLFMHAYSCAERNPLKDWLEKTSYRWPFHLMYQHRCFLAAAHYWQSKAELEADQYGNEIAFLQQGAAIAADAKKYEAELIQGLIDSRARLAEMINARLAVAQKENESIYHYNVPAASALKEIEQKFVVTALAFDPSADVPKDGGAPFSNLVPMRVHEASATYMQTMNSICSQMTRECQEATDYAKMHLASLGLPAALEAIEPDSGFPPSVWARVNEVQLKGGLRALQELQSQVRELGAECAAGLAEVREWLNSESTDDRDMRQQFGRKWNRVPSAQISASFVKDAESIDRYLKTAGASDRDITRELSASEEMLRSLEASQSELESRLPKQGPSEAKSASSERLRGLLDQLSTLIDRRTIAMKKLESQVSQENIVAALMAVPDTVPPEQIFAEERKKFEPLRNDIASALDEQKTLLEKVTSANEDFVKTKSSGQAASAREKVLQDLNVAVDKHAKLMANLNEGIKFYTDIQKDYLAPLKQTVADFMLAREAEKKMLLEQLQAESAKASSIPSRPPASAYATPAPAPAPAPQQQYAPAPESYTFNDFQQGSGPAPASAPAPQGYGAPYGGPQGYSQPAPGPAYGSQAYAPPGPAYGSAPQNPAYGAPAPAPNPSYGAPAPQSNAYATIMAPPAASYGSAYPSNPNLNAGFGGDHSYPVPSRGGVQPIQAPSYASSPRGSPSQPSAQPKAGEWSCPSCTFINSSRAMVCFMCNTDNPHPTPAGSVPAQSQPQIPAQPAKSGWRNLW